MYNSLNSFRFPSTRHDLSGKLFDPNVIQQQQSGWHKLFTVFTLCNFPLWCWYMIFNCLLLSTSFRALLPFVLFYPKKTSNHKKSYFLANQLSQRIPNARSQSNWIWMFISSIRLFLSISFMIFVECTVSFIYISFRTNKDLYWMCGTYCVLKPQYKITYTFGFWMHCLTWKFPTNYHFVFNLTLLLL